MKETKSLGGVAMKSEEKYACSPRARSKASSPLFPRTQDFIAVSSNINICYSMRMKCIHSSNIDGDGVANMMSE